MNFLLDANLPRSIGSFLLEQAHQVCDIRDIKPAAKDSEIYEMIQKESMLLLTRDLDFGNILLYPPTPTCGIILLRTQLLTVLETIALLQNLLQQVAERDFLGSLIVVTPHRFRIKKV